MAGKSKTTARYKRKILKLNSDVTNLENALDLSKKRLEKADTEIVILQEDLADAGRLVDELESKTENVESVGSRQTDSSSTNTEPEV